MVIQNPVIVQNHSISNLRTRSQLNPGGQSEPTGLISGLYGERKEYTCAGNFKHQTLKLNGFSSICQ